MFALKERRAIVEAFYKALIKACDESPPDMARRVGDRIYLEADVKIDIVSPTQGAIEAIVRLCV